MRIDNVEQVLADSLARARGNEPLIDFDHRSMAQQNLSTHRAGEVTSSTTDPIAG